MDQKYLKQVSKQMSWILRHEAERLGLHLDAEGFVSVDDLLPLLRETMPDVSDAHIEAVVESIEPQKQRFLLVDGCIRANYGHSLDARIAYSATEPPDLLFHGTTNEAASKILASGLLPMNRQFVHLTIDKNLATQIGGRHGKPLLLLVDAGEAHRDGINFYNANRGFWLAASVPARYVRKHETS